MLSPPLRTLLLARLQSRRQAPPGLATVVRHSSWGLTNKNGTPTTKVGSTSREKKKNMRFKQPIVDTECAANIKADFFGDMI